MDAIILFQSIVKAFLAFSLIRLLAFIVPGILLFVLFLRGLWPFLEQVRYERALLVAADTKLTENLKQTATSIASSSESKKSEGDMEDRARTGDIHVSGNKGPTQVNIGSPGSKQIINQQRTIRPQTRIEKLQRDGNYIMHIILTQTEGLWDPGTTFQINAKTSVPYERASIIQGLPPAMFNVQIGENKAVGEYFFSTTTAPFPDRPIILEIIAKKDFELLQLGVSPLAKE